MKKLKWIIAKLFGKKYFIEYVDWLEQDEVLTFGHRIYIGKKWFDLKNIEIKVNRNTSMVYLENTILGNDGENSQGDIIFSFVNDFVDGQARLEYEIKGEKRYLFLTKEEETYKTPIKSVLTKSGAINMQLVVTEGVSEDEIPIFKSNVFYVVCNNSLNAEIEEPEEYPSWIEIANTKLNSIDEAIAKANNLDIDVVKEENVATIIVTDQDGIEKNVEIYDGTPGKDGKDGQAGYTPQKGVDYFDGENGKDGQNGKDGEDYILTEADKQEIASLVLAELPDSEEVSY